MIENDIEQFDVGNIQHWDPDIRAKLDLRTLINGKHLPNVTRKTLPLG